MKKKLQHFVLLSMALLVVSTAFSQKQNFPSKLKDGQAGTIDTRIDKMSYWMQKAEEGLTPYNPVIPFAQAKYTGSTIDATTVAKDDSPDVPVTSATNVTQSENSAFIDPSDAEFLLNSNNSTSWSGGSSGTLYGANYYYSADAGLTWGGSQQGAGGGNSGDPTTAINLDGTRMYVNYISNPGGMGIAYSTDGGSTWTPKTIAPNPGQLADKNHMWIDNSPTSSHEGNLYVAWTPFGGSDDSEIVISRSTDEGDTWSSPLDVSSAVNAGSHNQGVNVQTGPNGEVYVVWTIYDSWPSDETALGFAMSTDGGVTYSTATRIITNIRGIRTSETSKNQRVNSFPSMTVDISGGGYNGNIYVTWTNIGVPGVNTGNDISVYMIRSTDDGASWSTPIRVNQDDPADGNEHYFPWIACDPETGILSAIFYDDRNVGGSQCEVFCANSLDAGETWEDFKVSDVSFTPSPISGLAGDYMGDYLSITARGSMVYPVWTDNRGGIFMTYVSPYVTNSLPKPINLMVDLNEETGATELSWEYEDTKDFLFFNVYRDGTLLGTTTDLTYSDQLPDYGVFNYGVTAMHDDGESVAAAASIQWGNPHVAVNPMAIVENLPVGGSSTQIMTIENVGELELTYTISPEITSKKSGKDYCAASGGCDEYISNVTFGDINNSSSCDDYGDYTNLSTLVNTGETYEISITNGNEYSADDLGVWIDWNQDQDFDDPGENVVCEGDNGGQGTFDIEVPVTAMAGETRMRVRIKWGGSDCGDPCGSTSYGEVEDYTIAVLGWLMLDPLSGTVMPGETENIDVMFDAADLTEGIYSANLNISSNDPDSPMLVVPVTLNVGDDLPMLDAFADPAEICEGGSTQLFANATGGSGNFDYAWTSDPPGFNSSEQNPMVTPVESTAYVCEVNDGSFSVFDTAMVYVMMMPGMSATPAGEEMLCQDAPNTTYETTGATDATSYMWMISPEGAGTVSGEGTIGIVDWDAAFSGEATVTVKGINDCGEGDVSDGLVVMIDPLPEACAIPIGETMLCEGVETADYETTGAANALSYMWMLIPETAGIIEGDGMVATVTWDAAFLGDASISVYGMNDCGDGVASEELMVSVSMLPDVTFDMAQDSACVYNPAFALTGGNPAGGVYSGPGVSNGEFDPAMAGNGEHTITYTFMENGCENMAEDVIYVGECLGINEVVDGIAISIYPNPNSGMFTMTLDSDVARSLNMKILNNQGAVVYSEENIDGNKKFSRKMDLTGYGKGIYFIHIYSGETQYLKKIIIE